MTLTKQKINLLVGVKKKIVLKSQLSVPIRKGNLQSRGHVRLGLVVCPLVVYKLD
jgi:hypothetical protein